MLYFTRCGKHLEFCVSSNNSLHSLSLSLALLGSLFECTLTLNTHIHKLFFYFYDKVSFLFFFLSALTSAVSSCDACSRHWTTSKRLYSSRCWLIRGNINGKKECLRANDNESSSIGSCQISLLQRYSSSTLMAKIKSIFFQWEVLFLSDM